MTNTTNTPKWVQAAIAKLTEKHDEKRQTFKERGDRYHDGFADGLDAAETIFMREFERTEPQSGWISVADRLPENPSQEVNILLKTGEVRIALFEQWIPMGQTKPVHYFTGDIYHVDGYEYQCTTFDDVTHWQPLPLPPKTSE